MRHLRHCRTIRNDGRRYNEVKDLYESDEIAADEDIENLMNEAADVINEMGEISQDSITEKDAEDLNGAMVDILEGLSCSS